MAFHGVGVRVKGQLCDMPRKLTAGVGGIVVRNLSSKQQGTVFLQGTHAKFVSNELVLVSGKNIVQVEWNDPATGKEKKLTAELFEP